MPKRLSFTAEELSALLPAEAKEKIRGLVEARNFVRQTKGARVPGRKREWERVIQRFGFPGPELVKVTFFFGKGAEAENLSVKAPDLLEFIQEAINKALRQSFHSVFYPSVAPDGTKRTPRKNVSLGNSPPTFEFRIIEEVINCIDFRKVNPPPSLYSLMAATAELFGLTDENDITAKDAKNAISGRLSRLERQLIAAIYKKKTTPETSTR